MSLCVCPCVYIKMPNVDAALFFPNTLCGGSEGRKSGSTLSMEQSLILCPGVKDVSGSFGCPLPILQSHSACQVHSHHPFPNSSQIQPPRQLLHLVHVFLTQLCVLCGMEQFAFLTPCWFLKFRTEAASTVASVPSTCHLEVCHRCSLRSRPQIGH